MNPFLSLEAKVFTANICTQQSTLKFCQRVLALFSLSTTEYLYDCNALHCFVFLFFLWWWLLLVICCRLLIIILLCCFHDCDFVCIYSSLAKVTKLQSCCCSTIGTLLLLLFLFYLLNFQFMPAHFETISWQYSIVLLFLLRFFFFFNLWFTSCANVLLWLTACFVFNNPLCYL